MDTLKDNTLKKKESDNKYEEMIKSKIEEYNSMMREKIKKMENKEVDE